MIVEFDDNREEEEDRDDLDELDRDCEFIAHTFIPACHKTA